MATSSGYSSSSTFPIRAPLTLDSDSENSLSSKGQIYEYNNTVSNSSSYGSDISGFESEGFLSGDDEFETTSGRPFVADPVDVSAENGDFDSKEIGFRPFVNDQNGENNEYGVSRAYVAGTSGGDELETASGRPFVADLDDDSAENDDFVGKDNVFRPFLSDPNGESNKYGAYVATPSRKFVVNSVENGNFVRVPVGFRSYENDPRGKLSENGVPRASMAGTSVELIANLDVDSAKNCDFVHNHVGFGLSVNDPYGKNNDEFFEDNVVIRPIVNDPCGKINENGVSRAYAADTDEKEISPKPTKGGKYGDFGESSLVHIGISEIRKPSIPIAKLSRDSDEESLSSEDVENDEFSGSVRIPNSHSLEKTESAIRVKVSADEELEEEEEEEDGSEFEPELDDEAFEKMEMSESVSEITALQGGEIDASGPNYTSFANEAKDTVSTKVMQCGDFIDYDDKNDSINGSEDPKLVEISFAESVKRDNLGAEMEDEPPRSITVYDPLLVSTLESLDIEFTELKDKESYGKGNSERSFSIDDYSNGSIIDDIDKTSSPGALDGKSKDFWLGDSNDDVDTLEESKEKEFSDSNASDVSPRKNLNEQQRRNSERIQLIRAKFFKLVQRLGLSLEDPIASQVLCKLILIEGEPSNQQYTFESAMDTAMELEYENGKADFDFSLNILVIGKTGVGKSATINSLFNEEKSSVSAFEPATTCVKEIFGTINGIKVRIFDTPGLRPLPKEQSFNSRVFSSIKRLVKKYPPDIVLYVDRLDMGKGDLNDLQLLRLITKFLGSLIWEKAVIILTHAGSSPPDGSNGLPLSYDLFVAQRLRSIQLMISRSLGHSMLDLSSIGSFSLVENHLSLSQVGENGEKSIFNGEKWRPKLLFLCSSMKILSEANLVAKNQDLLGQQKVFSSPLSHDQEYECDELQPFKPLTKTLVKNKYFRSLENLSMEMWPSGIHWSGNLQSRFLLGQKSKMVFRVGLKDELNEQVSVRISGLEQLQLMLLWYFLNR